jgi:N-acyl homoserine lactone hydrolase
MTLRHENVTELRALDFGLFDVGPGKRTILCPGFLITTDAGRRILFDTGFPPAYATDERATAMADGLDRFGRLVNFCAAQTAEGALALLGLRVADISHVILSHSHIDHVGSLALFTHAQIILTATERAEPAPLYFGANRPMAWPQAHYRTLKRATQICNGLRLIPTPGHTAGHLSALVTVGAHKVMLTADAINRASEPAEGFPDADDPITAAKSAAKVLRLARRTKAEVIYGHEPAQATTLGRRTWP